MPFELKKTPLKGLIAIKAEVIGEEGCFPIVAFVKLNFESKGIEIDVLQMNYVRLAQGVPKCLYFPKELL